jgi:S-adenosylmethionine:diacylglycerol 3-amino-3-carboxypropyl transferase
MTLIQGSDWSTGEIPLRAGDAVLAAAEGGDRVLRMLSGKPRRLAVVDRIPDQRYLLDLKLSAVKALPYAEYLELVGLRPSRRRRALFQRVRWLLAPESDSYWLGHLGMIDRGVAAQGVLERRLASFRTFVRLVHGQKKIERYLALRNEAERRAMFEDEWQTLLWRRFGPWLWRRWFEVSAERLERLLLEGRLLAAPPGLTPAEFEAAKELARRVILVGESPEEYVRTLPSRSVDLFELGRMDLRGLEEGLARVAAPGARVECVTEQRVPPAGFVPGGEPREAGFLPGHIVLGIFPA